jgi:dTMP kinase
LSSFHRGRLIAVEGIDGCGKTTQAKMLSKALGALLTFEPGATALGKEIRGLLLDVSLPHPVARAEALLMAADRAQHVDEVVRPALEDGKWVVTDRYSGSTLAYQGAGRQLGVAALRQIVEWAADDLAPDLSILLDVPVPLARRRLASSAPDRLERLQDDFHERVREGFLSLAAEKDWVVVDGEGDTPQVHDEIMRAVERRLGLPGSRRFPSEGG